MSNFEIHPSVSPADVTGYFEQCQVTGQQIHTLLIQRGETLLVRASAAPYACTDLRENYSLSKSITSIAIGMLIDDGRLSLQDRLVDLFPEAVPEDADPRLSHMCIEHLLRMATGHAADTMPTVEFAADPVSAFFACPFSDEPGTRFVYNTGATCVLGETVRKVSGMTLLDFCTERLFRPLGITRVRWNTTASGASEGGAGIQLCADDILKIGLLLLHEGVSGGQRLLSASYIHAASSLQTSTAHIWDNIDSACGYGYQFWLNSAGGFRADGSNGQFCFVFPKTDTVVVVQSFSPNVQVMMDALYAWLPHLTDRPYIPCPAPAVPVPPLPPAPVFPVPQALYGTYRLAPNPQGFTRLLISSAPNALNLTFSNGNGLQTMTAGIGYYCDSTLRAPHLKPKLISIMRSDYEEELLMSTCCTPTKKGVILSVCHRSSPMSERWMLSISPSGALTVTIGTGEFHRAEASVLHGKRCEAGRTDENSVKKRKGTLQ